MSRTEQWRALYAQAAQQEDDEAAVSEFIKQVLVKDCEPDERAKRLRTAARVMTKPVEELLKLPRETKLRHLQLQVVCRLLSCCDRKKTKAVRKETRGLLDRIALLLDAANPPSLMDEDQQSPFQRFIIDVLQKQLGDLVPEVMQYVLKVYEQADDDDEQEPELKATSLTPMIKQLELPTASPSVDISAKRSILGALRDERPTKRSRPEVDDQFKEMLLPQQLKQQKPRAKLLRRSSSSAKDKEKDKTKHSSSKTKDADPAAPVKRQSSGSKHKHRSDSAPKEKPITPKAVPLLVRNVDRALFTGPSAANPLKRATTNGDRMLLSGPASGSLKRASTSTGVPGAPITRPALLRPASFNNSIYKPKLMTTEPPKAAPSGPVASLQSSANASVVMRTPDRPRRLPPRNTQRILIESSPPLRNPLARARSGGAKLPPPPPPFR